MYFVQSSNFDNYVLEEEEKLTNSRSKLLAGRLQLESNGSRSWNHHLQDIYLLLIQDLEYNSKWCKS